MNNENKKKIKINGQELTIKEYNNLYKLRQHPTLKRLGVLYNEIEGCHFGEGYQGVGSREESEKSKRVNRDLYKQFMSGYDNYDKKAGSGGFAEIWETDSKERIESTVEKSENFFKEVELTVNLGEQLVSQRNKTGNEYNEKPYQDPNPNQSHEEWKKQGDNLRKWRESAKQAIEVALNQEPRITTTDLDWENRSWEDNLAHAVLGEEEINEIKNKVLTDIKKKREEKSKSEDSGPSFTPPTESETPQDDALAQLRKNVISEIGDASVLEPEIYREDLQPGNKDWRYQINNSNSEKEINQIKEQVLIDIACKREAKKRGTTLDEILRRGSDNLRTLDESLKKVLAAIGSSSYEEKSQELTGLKEELAKANLGEYRKVVLKIIEDELTRLEITREELGSDTHSNLEKLESEEITNEKDFVATENSVLSGISVRGAFSKLDKLIRKADDYLKGRVKASLEEVRFLQKEIRKFISEDSSFQQSAFQEKKSVVEEKIEKLENYSETNNTQTESANNLLRKEVVIPVALGAFLVLLLAIFLVRKHQKAKVKGN